MDDRNIEKRHNGLSAGMRKHINLELAKARASGDSARIEAAEQEARRARMQAQENVTKSKKTETKPVLRRLESRRDESRAPTYGERIAEFKAQLNDPKVQEPRRALLRLELVYMQHAAGELDPQAMKDEVEGLLTEYEESGQVVGDETVFEHLTREAVENGTGRRMSRAAALRNKYQPQVPKAKSA